jgi:hypothetical protein
MSNSDHGNRPSDEGGVEDSGTTPPDQASVPETRTGDPDDFHAIFEGYSDIGRRTCEALAAEFESVEALLNAAADPDEDICHRLGLINGGRDTGGGPGHRCIRLKQVIADYRANNYRANNPNGESPPTDQNPPDSDEQSRHSVETDGGVIDTETHDTDQYE